MLPRRSSRSICCATASSSPCTNIRSYSFGALILGRQQHAIARPGKAPVAFIDVDPEVQGREASHLPQFLGDELVERNRITETALEGAARGGQQTVVGAVSTRDTGMRKPAEDREITAELGKRRQIRR